jgi:hypothetical protein
MPTPIYGHGRLTDADRARIIEFADAGLKAGQIAQRLKRCASTIHWHMVSTGLIAPKAAPDAPHKPYMRGDQVVCRYTAQEDAFIQALRVQGFGFEEIAQLSARRYSIRRTAHSIQCRLIMLSAREDAE